ncbi:MAG: hypothetical protein WCX61_04375 [Candidatus Peribacteraceae bacterium]
MVSAKKITLAALAATVLAGLVHFEGVESLVSGVAYAADNPPDQTFNDIFLFMGVLLSGIHYVLYFVIRLLEVLLDPYSFVDIFFNVKTGYNPLLEIWQISRDIMNIIFVFMLIAGAVLTIVLPNKKNLAVDYIPKFILAVILVNFSWFFPRVIIDVANVLTATVYSLPSAVGSKCEYLKSNGLAYSTEPCFIWEDAEFNVTADKAAELQGQNWICLNNNAVCFKKVNLSDKVNSAQGIILGMVFSHARLVDLITLPRPQVPAGGLAGDLNNLGNAPLGSQNMQLLLRSIMQAMFAVLLSIALFFPLLAMLVAFTIRIPVLWITIAFMPFMFLGFVIGDKMGQLNTMEKIWKTFISAAFLPFVTAIPMAAGYILLNAGAKAFSNANFASTNPAIAAQSGVQNLGLSGLYTFLDLLWLIMCLMVIWMGTFTMLKTAKFAEGMVSKIQSWGQNFGKMVGMLPLITPIIPVPARGGGTVDVSAMGLMQASNPRRIMSGWNAQAQREAGSIFGSGGGSGGGGNNGSADAVAQRIDASRDRNTIQANFRNAFKTVNDIDIARLKDTTQLTPADKNSIRALRDLASSHGLNENGVEIQALLKKLNMDAENTKISQLTTNEIDDLLRAAT